MSEKNLHGRERRPWAGEGKTGREDSTEKKVCSPA